MVTLSLEISRVRFPFMFIIRLLFPNRRKAEDAFATGMYVFPVDSGYH
jgi:hypothetical protein